METPFETQVLTNWLDQNGLVKTHPTDTSSGNGILYSAIFVILSALKDSDASFAKPWLESKVDSCYYKKGCLMRNPQDSFGQEQWDDYLGVAASCIFTGETQIPREILWYGITHFFIFDNDGDVQFQDWIGRFPQVWALMAPAAFPFIAKWFKWPLNFILWLIGITMKINTTDASGTELQWIYMVAYAKLMNSFQNTNSLPMKWRSSVSMTDVMKGYYAANHPFLQEWGG